MAKLTRDAKANDVGSKDESNLYKKWIVIFLRGCYNKSYNKSKIFCFLPGKRKENAYEQKTKLKK